METTSIEYELQQCEYRMNKQKNKPRSIVNLNTKEVFESINKARQKYNNLCTNEIKLRHKINGCYFQYKDIVDQTSIEYELDLCLKQRQKSIKDIPIVDLTTGQEFQSFSQAVEWLVENEHISPNTMLQPFVSKKMQVKGHYFQLKELVDANGLEYELDQCKKKCEANKKRLKDQSKSIRNLTTGELFESNQQLIDQYGILGVSTAIRKRIKANGCYWQYESEVQKTSIEYQLQQCLNNANSNRAKSYRRVQNIDTGEIFESVAKAKQSLGKNVNIISAIKLGTRCGGYYWKYVD